VRKAVVAVPPVVDFYFTPHRASALGARSLTRELERTGWNTVLLNFPLRGKAQTVPLPGELEYLKPFIIPDETGPLSWFTAYHRFGPSFSLSADMISRENPEVLFISSFAWAYAREALQLAETTALLLPELPIIIGGHGPTALPDYFLNAVHPLYPDKPLFSRVIAGEIEGFGELLFPGNQKERYLDFRESDLMPEPEPIAGESISRAGRRSISITLTRGCPLKCRFCSNHICHGRRFRSSARETWEKEVAGVVNNGKGEQSPFHLNIEDDNILFLKNDFFSFLDSMKTRYPDISFSAENGLDYMRLDLQDISRLENLGFTHLNLSLAVLSPELRKKEKRDGDPEKLERLLQRCREKDLSVTTHFICGLDGDSSEDILRTLKFLDNLPSQTGISNFYPVPGLEGFTDKSLFLKSFPGLARGSSVYPWTKALSSMQMLTAFRLARWSNFRKKMERDSSIMVTGPEEELYRTILKTRRLHTIRRRGKGRTNRAVVPLPRLDDEMVRGFFS